MELLLFILIPCTAAVALCLAYIQIQTWVDDKQLKEWEEYRRLRLMPKMVVTHTSTPLPLTNSKEKFVKDMWKRYNETHPTKSYD